VSQIDEIRHPSAVQAAPSQGGTEVHVRSSRDYDAAGNLRVVTRYGRVAPDDRPLDDVVRTETLPTNNRCKQDWACLAGASQIIETWPGDTYDTTLRKFEFEYNATSDPTELSGDLDYPHSERAALSRRLDLGTAAPLTASTLPGKKSLRTFGYDEFGNLVSVHGHSPTSSVCTDITFDTAYAQFTDSITSHAGTACTGIALTSQNTFDRGTGAISSTTYPNRTTGKIEYDPFGRQSAVFAPAADLGPSVDLAATFVYHTQSPVPWTEVRTRVGTDTFLTSIELFNAVGEHILGFDQADPVSDGAPWVLRDWTERDGDGHVRQIRRPWLFSADPRQMADYALATSAIGHRFQPFTIPSAGRR
jgi:hypothetical protein